MKTSKYRRAVIATTLLGLLGLLPLSAAGQVESAQVFFRVHDTAQAVASGQPPTERGEFVNRRSWVRVPSPAPMIQEGALTTT